MDDLEGESTHARRLALRRATWLGLVCGSGCYTFGKPFEAAAIDGLIVVVGGLIAWTTYHLISHRTDCLMLVAMNFLPIWRKSDDPWLPTMVITSLAMFGVGLVMGFVNRSQVEGEPDHDFAWWDPDLDGPR